MQGDWVEKDGVWTLTEGRMVYTVAPSGQGFTASEKKTGCAPNSVEHFLSERGLGFQLTLEAAQKMVEGHVWPPKMPLKIARCPECGADEASRKWRFVAAPGGGLWACDCGGMWREPYPARKVCATCVGIDNEGAAYCPISLEMAEQFGGSVEDMVCPYWTDEPRAY